MLKISPLFFFAITLSFAQPPELDWSQTYGPGTSDDWCWDIAMTWDGGYIMTGWTEPVFGGSADIYVVRTDDDGNELWSRTYGDTTHETSWAILPVNDFGFLISGTKAPAPGEPSDLWLIKLDESGDSLWSRTYTSAGYNPIWQMIEEENGDFLLVGGMDSTGAGDRDGWLIKINANGDSLWSRTYGGSEFDSFYEIRRTSDDGYLLAGTTDSFVPDTTAFWLLKVDENGDSLWSRTYAADSIQYLGAMTSTLDGGYLLTGAISSTGMTSDSSDIWIVKVSSAGDSLWTRRFGGDDYDNCRAVFDLEDGGFMLTAHTASFGAGYDDAWLIRLTDSGDTLWTRTYGTEVTEPVFDAVRTLDHGFALLGITFPFHEPFDFDFLLVKLSAEGTPVHPLPPPLVNRYVLYPPFPNPFNAATSLRFVLPAPSLVTLELYDLLGRHLSTITNEHYSAGRHEVIFDGSSLASGVYFAKMKSGSFVQSTRLILLK